MTFLGHHDTALHLAIMVLASEPLHVALWRILKADSLCNAELLATLKAMAPPPPQLCDAEELAQAEQQELGTEPGRKSLDVKRSGAVIRFPASHVPGRGSTCSAT